MSALSLHKLKKQLKVISTEEVCPCIGKTTNKAANTESMHLLEKMEECDNNNNINEHSSYYRPVLVETIRASLTTSKLIETTLRASNDPTNPNTRFLNYFPPPIPPPQYLQPGFRKYKINYEPPARQRPCIGWRRFPA